MTYVLDGRGQEGEDDLPTPVSCITPDLATDVCVDVDPHDVHRDVIEDYAHLPSPLKTVVDAVLVHRGDVMRCEGKCAVQCVAEHWCTCHEQSPRRTGQLQPLSLDCHKPLGDGRHQSFALR